MVAFRNRDAGNGAGYHGDSQKMNEKSLYLTKIKLKAELDRCLNCRTQPCMNACPVNCNPHEFIQFAQMQQWPEAVRTIMRTNPMGQTCGLICPDKFCMKSCTRSQIDFPINIPRVQATILENYRNRDVIQPETSEPNGKRIAIIGAGPAGLAASAKLAQNGYMVEIFEASDRIGGALNMIPAERLPHEVIEKDWSFIHDTERVSLHLNQKIADPRTLLDAFDYIIIATGEPNCVSLRIPGEDLSISYMDYLTNREKYRTSGAVAVIGGGNVATDCALTALRLGASSVEMFIRRRIADMRISRPEFLELIDHGINLNGMTSPEKIVRNAQGLSLFIHRNVYDGQKWQPLPDSTIELPYFSLVIRAIGSRADEKLPDDPRMIYAGDCKTGGSTIVEAIASGRAAADLVLEHDS